MLFLSHVDSANTYRFMLFRSNVVSANLPLMDLITGTFSPYRAVGRFENPGIRDCSPSRSILSNYRDLSPYWAVGRFENLGVRDCSPSRSTLSNYRDLSPYNPVGRFENPGVRDCSPSCSNLSNYRDLSPYRTIGRFENPGVPEMILGRGQLMWQNRNPIIVVALDINRDYSPNELFHGMEGGMSGHN